MPDDKSKNNLDLVYSSYNGLLDAFTLILRAYLLLLTPMLTPSLLHSRHKSAKAIGLGPSLPLRGGGKWGWRPRISPKGQISDI